MASVAPAVEQRTAGAARAAVSEEVLHVTKSWTVALATVVATEVVAQALELTATGLEPEKEATLRAAEADEEAAGWPSAAF